MFKYIKNFFCFCTNDNYFESVETCEEEKQLKDRDVYHNISAAKPQLLLSKNQMDILLKENNSKDNSQYNFFNLDEQEFIAKVIEVKDGDTITILFIYGIYPVKAICRMNGYDSPELHPRNAENEDLKQLEIKAAIHCKNFLSDIILNKIIYVKTSKRHDHYGRVLVDIYKSDKFEKEEYVNDIMISANKGVSYKGDKKKPFSHYLEYYKDCF